MPLPLCVGRTPLTLHPVSLCDLPPSGALAVLGNDAQRWADLHGGVEEDAPWSPSVRLLGLGVDSVDALPVFAGAIADVGLDTPIANLDRWLSLPPLPLPAVGPAQLMPEFAPELAPFDTDAWFQSLGTA